MGIRLDEKVEGLAVGAMIGGVFVWEDDGIALAFFLGGSCNLKTLQLNQPGALNEVVLVGT